MLVGYNELGKENARNAIIRCIELMGLKNPDIIKKVDDETYSHTNTRGRTRYFKVVYGWNKYVGQDWKEQKHKLHKVNGFYIGEFSTI